MKKMLEVKLKHMLEALLKEMLEASLITRICLMHTTTKGLSRFERYFGDPKDILTFHEKTEIIIILCLLNAFGKSEEKN